MKQKVHLFSEPNKSLKHELGKSKDSVCYLSLGNCRIKLTVMFRGPVCRTVCIALMPLLTRTIFSANEIIVLPGFVSQQKPVAMGHRLW